MPTSQLARRSMASERLGQPSASERTPPVCRPIEHHRLEAVVALDDLVGHPPDRPLRSSRSMTRVRGTKTPPYGGAMRRSRSAKPLLLSVRASQDPLHGQESRAISARRRTLDRFAGTFHTVVGGVEPAGPHEAGGARRRRSEGVWPGRMRATSLRPARASARGPRDDRTDRHGGDPPLPRCAGSTHQPSSTTSVDGAAERRRARPPPTTAPTLLDHEVERRCRPAGGPPSPRSTPRRAASPRVGRHPAPPPRCRDRPTPSTSTGASAGRHGRSPRRIRRSPSDLGPVRGRRPSPGNGRGHLGPEVGGHRPRACR